MNRSSLESLRKRWYVRTPADLEGRCVELNAGRYWVEGIVPTRSICLLAGRSGLGKSPLAYQLAVAVSSGRPFLGIPVQQGTVLYLDYENGLAQVLAVQRQLSIHLGLEWPPEDLLCWSGNDAPPNWGKEGWNVWEMVEEIRPGLVIVDSLGSCQPDAEENNFGANKVLQQFRRLMMNCTESEMSVMLIHHLKKPFEQNGAGSISLEDADPRRWFDQVRGAGALVNGTDVRLGIDEPGLSTQRKRDGQSEVAVVLRGFGRVVGEIPTMYLARLSDEEGVARGYDRITGPDLLLNQDHAEAFRKLPDKFRFKEAKHALAKGDQATTDFLKKSQSIGIIRPAKGGKGYEKV
jgi:hypothetical protein